MTGQEQETLGEMALDLKWIKAELERNAQLNIRAHDRIENAVVAIHTIALDHEHRLTLNERNLDAGKHYGGDNRKIVLAIGGFCFVIMTAVMWAVLIHVGWPMNP